MDSVARMITAVALMWGVGCVRSDWIDRTLVTVNVTGTWHGRGLAKTAGGGTTMMLLELQQEANLDPPAPGRVLSTNERSRLRQSEEQAT
jgi:hypothetical protein